MDGDRHRVGGGRTTGVGEHGPELVPVVGERHDCDGVGARGRPRDVGPGRSSVGGPLPPHGRERAGVAPAVKFSFVPAPTMKLCGSTVTNGDRSARFSTLALGCSGCQRRRRCRPLSASAMWILPALYTKGPNGRLTVEPALRKHSAERNPAHVVEAHEDPPVLVRDPGPLGDRRVRDVHPAPGDTSRAARRGTRSWSPR